MHVVDAGKAVERLIGRRRHAQRGIARQHAEAVAMPVDREIGRAAQRLHRREAAPVQRHHRAGAAFGRDQVGMAAHRVGLVGDVERHHDAASGAILMRAHARHHGADALADRRHHGIGADLVVLDEVEPGGAKLADEFAGLLGAHADIRLDDGAEQRAAVHVGERARARDALTRHRERAPVVRRQRQRHQLEAGRLAEIVEVARDRRGERRQIGADIADRERHRDAARADTARRAPAAPATRWAGSASRPARAPRSCRRVARLRARRSSVSPGTRRKVPLDCSPASTSATRAGSSGVSSR